MIDLGRKREVMNLESWIALLLLVILLFDIDILFGHKDISKTTMETETADEEVKYDEKEQMIREI